LSRKLKNKIWISPPDIGDKEQQYVKDCFDSNWISTAGPQITFFEKELSLLSDNYSVAALSSGTAAIHLALILLGVQKDDEVICSTFTFSASANPIIYQGAKPIFIDSELDTWNMCPELLEEAIIDRLNQGKKPKAIILVYIYGMPAKINEISMIAKKYDIPIIEDAAEALGSKYLNKQLGSFFDFGIYSFNGNKIITSSGGGALISKNHKLIEKAKFLATQAKDDVPYYQHSEIGYNYRLSNVCAAIGRGQLDTLKDKVVKRRSIFNYYKDNLSCISDIEFLEERNPAYSNRWLTTIIINDSNKIDPEIIRLHLVKHNIESRRLWKPMHTQPVFKEFQFYGGDTSESLFKKGLCLPSGSSLSNNQLDYIINVIKELYEA
tara:strand:- start:2939 stop:4078 length:1140 start_codon:yes stop_codon:yes gene_type:complete